MPARRLETDEQFAKDLRFLAEVITTLSGVTDAVSLMRQLAQSSDLCRFANDAVRAAINLEHPRPTFRVSIDSTENEIDWTIAQHPSLKLWIPRHTSVYDFPWGVLQRSYEVDLEIFLFIREKSYEEIQSALANRGYRGAPLHEALALLHQHPDGVWDYLEHCGNRKLICLGTARNGFHPIIELAKSSAEAWADTWFKLMGIGWFNISNCHLVLARKSSPIQA